MDWLSSTDDTQKLAILAAVSHSLDYWDFNLDESEFAVGDAMLDELDDAVNGIRRAGVTELVDEDTLVTLWGSFFAFYRDVHAGQFNFQEQHWQIAENLFNLLNEELTEQPTV